MILNEAKNGISGVNFSHFSRFLSALMAVVVWGGLRLEKKIFIERPVTQLCASELSQSSAHYLVMINLELNDVQRYEGAKVTK